ncbi:hypothetical protein HAX54_024892 [Datura stramonium]|uniref:Transmembrane 9 superfamily member n=1 Tax=Datura stramonium TaxID=4076 RepID=A0ABS8S6M5_DATST|nr:hypothetical protein [Datura stramonium]
MVACNIVVLFVLCCVSPARSDGSDHKYKAGDPVPLYANKVGPFHNPSETYRFFDLPFCAPGDNYSFEKRMENTRSLFSIATSFGNPLVLNYQLLCDSSLLTGFLATLMRVLKNDLFGAYPEHKSLLAAALGSGTQLLRCDHLYFHSCTCWCLSYNRGALFTSLVVIYALTSGIAGYVASSFYCQLEGTNWVRNLILTGALFCGPLFLTFCFNSLLSGYTATAVTFEPLYIFSNMGSCNVLLCLFWGGIAGKNSKSEFQAPCRTTKYPREIPPLPWYRGTLPQMAMAGFLPFSAIILNFTTYLHAWGHRIYTIYSILFIVFIILLIVTAFITVALDILPTCC